MTLALAWSPSPSAAAAPTATVGSATILVGLLSRQGDRLCDGSPNGKWVNHRHEVGYVHLLAGKLKLERFENLPVIVKGRVVSSYRRPVLSHTGASPPPMQMRADWTQGMTGMRIQRSPGPGFAAFKVQSIKPWTGVSITRKADKVLVSLRNELGLDLHHLTLRLHYEGCYGKPGTTARSESRPVLRVGQMFKATFPILSYRALHGGKRAHRASAITLSGQTPGVALDFNWSLYKAGAGVQCPRMMKR